MNEKICRLCLQTTSENYHEQIGETLNNILKLNLGISKETVTCTECTNNLQILFNLKSACVDLRERTLSLTELKNDVSPASPVKIENTNNLKPVTEAKDEIRCRFCTKSTGNGNESLILLHESKENIFLVDMLEKYLPELNLSNNEELVTCKTCLDAMQGVSSFLKKCWNVEEKISKYAEIEGTDDKGQVELQNVQQFIFKPILKSEDQFCHIIESRQIHDSIQGEFTMKTEDEITYEIEMVNLDAFVKKERDIKSEDFDIELEDIDIKSEQCDSFQEASVKIKLDYTHKNSSDIAVNNQKNYPGTKLFKCEMCNFETTRKPYLTQHKLVHKSPSEVKMYKCDICTLETKRKHHLEAHKLVHKNPSELTMLKCEICSYETKYRRTIRKHMLTHKDRSELTTAKCKMCPFETIHKYNLKKHMFVHKSPSEGKMYKCEICTYQTHHRYRLREHMVIHKSMSEIKIFKCDVCPFTVRYKRNLARHMLVHKGPSEVKMYKCDNCTYEAKLKNHLVEHQWTHKHPSEITMFKCGMCNYEAKHERFLKRHVSLIHNKVSKKTVPT